MDTMINPEELAIRWRVSLVTLNQWRWNGRGPKFVKIGNSILYNTDEIKAFEEKNTKSSTAISNQNNGREYERGPLVMQSPIRKKQLAQKWGFK
jgi:hypothetical protein